MYTNAEASAIRQKFWTSFGLYMSPIPSSTEEKINWINYKTGIKGISFKMNVDNNKATVAVEIFLKDIMLQHQYFEIFNTFALQLENSTGKKWFFEKAFYLENESEISKIAIELKNVNIFNEKDWPTIISFLKQSIISLDAFWTEYKPAFELL